MEKAFDEILNIFIGLIVTIGAFNIFGGPINLDHMIFFFCGYIIARFVVDKVRKK